MVSASLLTAPESRAALGRAWRIGPVYADDPSATRLDAAARRNGWQVIRRVRGTCFVIDLASLTEAGPAESRSRTFRRVGLDRARNTLSAAAA